MYRSAAAFAHCQEIIRKITVQAQLDEHLFILEPRMKDEVRNQNYAYNDLEQHHKLNESAPLFSGNKRKGIFGFAEVLVSLRKH